MFVRTKVSLTIIFDLGGGVAAVLTAAKQESTLLVLAVPAVQKIVDEVAVGVSPSVQPAQTHTRQEKQ